MEISKNKESKLTFHFPPQASCSIYCKDLKKTTATREDGTVYYSNYVCGMLFTGDDLKLDRYFVLDHAEFDRLDQVLGKYQNVLKKKRVLEDCLSSMDRFIDFAPKKLYLRRVNPESLDLNDSSQVFTDDVLEMIQILLSFQNTHSHISCEKFKKYKTQWTRVNPDIHSTIQLPDLVAVLNDFDIDKKFITIINDDVFIATANDFFNTANGAVTVCSSIGELVMSIAHAVFYIFLTVACGISFTMSNCKRCNKTFDCMEDYKRVIMRVLTEYTSLPNGSYISKEAVDRKIKAIKNHCVFIAQQSLPKFDWLKVGVAGEESMPGSHFKEIADSYGVPVTWDSSNNTILTQDYTVWRGRWFAVSCWAKHFFGQQNSNVKKMVVDRMRNMVPIEWRHLFVDKHISSGALFQNFLPSQSLDPSAQTPFARIMKAILEEEANRLKNQSSSFEANDQDRKSETLREKCEKCSEWERIKIEMTKELRMARREKTKLEIDFKKELEAKNIAIKMLIESQDKLETMMKERIAKTEELEEQVTSLKARMENGKKSTAPDKTDLKIGKNRAAPKADESEETEKMLKSKMEHLKSVEQKMNEWKKRNGQRLGEKDKEIEQLKARITSQQGCAEEVKKLQKENLILSEERRSAYQSILQLQNQLELNQKKMEINERNYKVKLARIESEAAGKNELTKKLVSQVEGFSKLTENNNKPVEEKRRIRLDS